MILSYFKIIIIHLQVLCKNIKWWQKFHTSLRREFQNCVLLTQFHQCYYN